MFVACAIGGMPENGVDPMLFGILFLSVTLLPLGLCFLRSARRIEAEEAARRRRIQRLDKLIDYQFRAFGDEDTKSNEQEEDEGKYEHVYKKVCEEDDEYIDRGKRNKRRR